MKTRVLKPIFAICAAAFLWSSSANALERAPVLSLEAAQKIAAGCVAKAKEMKWKMNVAVVDTGANLVVFERMDGAFLGSGDIARKKAETSAKFPFSTRFVEELAYGKDRAGGGAVPGIAHVPGMVAFAGGVLLMAGDAHIGGVGVSGGTADEDEICAKAGLEYAKDLLK